jgi:hypothetical protein
MRLGTRIATLVAVAALAVGALAGQAAAGTATLSLVYTGCVDGYGRNYDYTLRVQGTTTYSANGIRVEARAWGDDEWSDDFLGGPFVFESSWSGFYTIDFCMNKSTLNEDWGQDEIYAGVRVYDLSTRRQIESFESNRIHGYF